MIAKRLVGVCQAQSSVTQACLPAEAVERRSSRDSDPAAGSRGKSSGYAIPCLDAWIRDLCTGSEGVNYQYGYRVQYAALHACYTKSARVYVVLRWQRAKVSTTTVWLPLLLPLLGRGGFHRQSSMG